MLQYIEEARGNDAIPRAKRIAVAAGSKFGALSGAAMMLVIGLYLAMAPRVSRYGLVRLMPLSVRARIDEVLVTCDKPLSRWLLGQSESMLFVGATTALGLWLLDVPLALSVGVLSGLLAFIPFFGAIAGGLLAVLLGFMQGSETALYVLRLALVIKQIEGNVLMPLVERWAVGLPPVLGIAATVMLGLMFGLLGVLLAAPAMIALRVEGLYIKGVLEEAG